MKKNLYIEFIGMPCSGKSYYSKKLMSYFKKKKVQTNNFNYLSRFLKLFFLILFFLKYFKYSSKILYFFLNSNHSFNEIKKHFYYFINEASLRIFHEINQNIVINSEGFRYRSLFYTNKLSGFKKRVFLDKLIKVSPKIHLLIYINSNKKINFIRSMKRKAGFRYSLKDKFFYNMNEKIIKYIHKTSKKNSFVLDITKKTEKRDFQKIVNFINKNYE